MKWIVGLHEDFVPEFDDLVNDVRFELIALMESIKELGPHLTRPHADTLKGSRHANMKELRFYADHGVWRFAFAFDPQRQAVVLCGGDKAGGSEKRFYKRLLKKADDRFSAHLASAEAVSLKAVLEKHSRGKKR